MKPKRNAFWLDYTSFVCLWLLVLAIPCEGQIPIPYVGSISGGIALPSLVLCALLTWMRGYFRPPTRFHWPVFAFVVWISVSLFWSIDPSATIARVVTFAQLTLLLLLIWQQTASESRVCALIGAYVSGAFLAAFNTGTNFLQGANANTMRFGDTIANGRSLSDFQYGTNRYTTAGLNEDELGLLLALSIPLACYLIVRSRWSVFKIVSCLHLPLCVIAVILTGSRGSMVAAAVGLVAVPVIFFYVTPAKKVVFAAMACAAITGTTFLPPHTWDRFAQFQTDITEGTMSKRSLIWNAGLEVFRGSPFLGVGYDSYPVAVHKLLDRPMSAHNSFVGVLVELGVIGAGVFATMLGTLAWTAYCMGGLRRRIWLLMLLVWMLGVLSISFEHRKVTWVIFSLLLAHAASRKPSRVTAVAQSPVPETRRYAHYGYSGVS